MQLILDPPPAGLTVNADYPRLRQALANLVDNAVKYTPEGGTVTVGAESRPDAIALFVRDTGPGIAEHQQERIWERLYRGEAGEKERGLGLGLSLVRAVVEAHGGPGGGGHFAGSGQHVYPRVSHRAVGAPRRAQGARPLLGPKAARLCQATAGPPKHCEGGSPYLNACTTVTSSPLTKMPQPTSV